MNAFKFTWFLVRVIIYLTFFVVTGWLIGNLIAVALAVTYL